MTDSEEKAIYLIEKIVLNNLDNYCDTQEERDTMVRILERMVGVAKMEGCR